MQEAARRRTASVLRCLGYVLLAAFPIQWVLGYPFGFVWTEVIGIGGVALAVLMVLMANKVRPSQS